MYTYDYICIYTGTQVATQTPIIINFIDEDLAGYFPFINF